MPYRTFSLIVSLAAVFVSVRAFSQSPEDPQELAQARALFERDIEFATRPIRDRYLSRLDALKRSLGGRGDARGAVAVQDEIDRVKAATADQGGAAGMAGVWMILYNNGSTRRYTISAEGTVIFDEDGGKSIAPKVGKLKVKGTDLLLDFQDGTVERLKLSGKTLLTEYFSPKALYPGGKPMYQGSGTIIPGHK